MLKLLHIADVHLDAPFRWLGSRGKDQRRQLREIFRTVIDLALEERVDALLVAGDLFDSNAPSQDTVDLVQAQLRRLYVPAFLLPGTHDCYDDASIYRKLDFAGSEVRVFDDSHTAFELPTLSLTVHGRANCAKTSTASPLSGLHRNPNTRFNVGLAHGSLAMPGTENDFPLAPAEIAKSGMDYMALGHWHSYRDCSAAPVPAFYSGPPELLSAEEPGRALLVTLSGNGASIDPRRIGRRSYHKMDLVLDQAQGREEVRERIRALGDRDLVLAVALAGIRPLELALDPAELAQDLAPAFFSLDISDRSRPMLSPQDLEGFPETTVIGQFVRRMSARIEEAATAEDRRIGESALQLGVALLQDRQVLR